jgi:hypothetical protein
MIGQIYLDTYNSRVVPKGTQQTVVENKLCGT